VISTEVIAHPKPQARAPHPGLTPPPGPADAPATARAFSAAGSAGPRGKAPMSVLSPPSHPGHAALPRTLWAGTRTAASPLAEPTSPVPAIRPRFCPSFQTPTGGSGSGPPRSPAPRSHGRCHAGPSRPVPRGAAPDRHLPPAASASQHRRCRTSLTRARRCPQPGFGP